MVTKTPAVAERKRTLRVLVVDGSAEDARRIRETVAEDGVFLATTARSGAEAAALLRDGSYDIALVAMEIWSDEDSPVARYFRERPGECAVLLLASADEPTAVAMLRLGTQETIPRSLIASQSLTERLAAAYDESRSLRRRDTMVRWLEREARTDHLTGMFNRRVFDERLREVCDDARRTDTPTTVIVGDLVDTRTVNEVHGHEAGDDLIRRAAQAISRCVRANDFAARVAGDDFGIILAGADFELGKLIARRIAQEVERLNAGEWRNLVPVTFTFGVATGRNCQPGELFVAADQAMHDNQPARPVVTMLWPRIETDGPSVA